MLWQILIIGLIFLIIALAIVGWWLFKPLPSYTQKERLSQFPQENLPLNGAVSIYWDDYQIPFIESDNDDDAAFALGLVHAHLRLTQIEALRMISQGRLSEMVPLKILSDVDAGLRALGYGRATKKTYQNMPDSTKQWLNKFVAGYNHYKMGLTRKQIPQDLKLLGIDWRKEMTAIDILTIGKLTGSSPSWFSYFANLPLYNQPNGKELLKKIRALGNAGMVSHIPAGSSLELHPSLKELNELLLAQSRSGSNSLVLGKEKSVNNSGLIANDPHLGMAIPNFWVIVGLKTPSYYGVGMMIPGVPAFGFGRTADIAWGGTNLHGQDSDMVDVSDLLESDFTLETHRIKRRFLLDKTIDIRISPYGPVFSDLSFMPQIGVDYAMSWVGHHDKSDELTALLDSMKAKNFKEFRQAMETFAAPGQNFLYTDTLGNIGQIVAAHIPKRDKAYREKFFLTLEDYQKYWQNIQHAGTLPHAYNPDNNFLASANNRPYAGEPEIGYSFPVGFRVARIAELALSKKQWNVKDLQKLQSDSYSWGSHSIAKKITALLEQEDFTAWDEKTTALAEKFLPLIQNWNGYYEKASQGAAHYEFFYPTFAESLVEKTDMSEFYQLIRRTARQQLLFKEILARDDLKKADITTSLQAGLTAWNGYLKDMGKQDKSLKWGELHYVNIQHPLGNVPVVGRKYRFFHLPVAGANSSIFKTGFDKKTKPSAASYGTQSQHISDMADIDENYFVLLGGQDGYIGSENFYDQALLWHQRELIKLPLSDSGVEAHFTNKMVLQ